MHPRDRLVVQMAFKLSVDQHKAFVEKAAKYGSTSYILREIVIALNEGRLNIKPREKCNELGI